MAPRDIVPIGAAVIAACSGLYVAFQSRRLERELRLLSVALDQDIQTLHRARDAAVAKHVAYVYLLEYWKSNETANDAALTKLAEHSAHAAELRGLAFAIGDPELLDHINLRPTNRWDPDPERGRMIAESDERGRTQQIHTRIAQLLKEATEKRRAPWWRRLRARIAHRTKG